MQFVAGFLFDKGVYTILDHPDGKKQYIARLKEASVTGVWCGAWAAHNPELASRQMHALAAMVDAGTLRPRVTESYPLERFAEAFAAITGRRALGKVVLTMG